MSTYMIERRYGRCNRDWLCGLTEHATVWSGAGNALVFGSKRGACRALAAAKRLMVLCPGGALFDLVLIHDRRGRPSSVASLGDEPRPRAGSWVRFERRFRPIAHPDGSLIWDYADLPQPVDASRIWTVLDCDGRLYASAGFHYVNRIGYLRTQEPWGKGDDLRDWRYA